MCVCVCARGQIHLLMLCGVALVCVTLAVMTLCANDQLSDCVCCGVVRRACVMRGVCGVRGEGVFCSLAKSATNRQKEDDRTRLVQEEGGSDVYAVDMSTKGMFFHSTSELVIVLAL